MSEYLLKDSSAKKAVRNWLEEAITRYANAGRLSWNDEDALTQRFFDAIANPALQTNTGMLQIECYKVRGRGQKAPEHLLGADGLGLVHIETSTTLLDGIFLFQAKKADSETAALRDAKKQCAKMLQHSSASQLIVLLPDCVHVVSALAVTSVRNSMAHLEDVPFMNFARFVVEQLLNGLMLAPLKDTLYRSLSYEKRYDMLLP